MHNNNWIIFIRKNRVGSSCVIPVFKSFVSCFTTENLSEASLGTNTTNTVTKENKDLETRYYICAGFQLK